MANTNAQKQKDYCECFKMINAFWKKDRKCKEDKEGS